MMLELLSQGLESGELSQPQQCNHHAKKQFAFHMFTYNVSSMGFYQVFTIFPLRSICQKWIQDLPKP